MFVFTETNTATKAIFVTVAGSQKLYLLCTEINEGITFRKQKVTLDMRGKPSKEITSLWGGCLWAMQGHTRPGQNSTQEFLRKKNYTSYFSRKVIYLKILKDAVT